MSTLDPIIEPRFRFELISDEALEALDINAGVLARECQCSPSALRNYQEAKNVPGGLVLGRMSQALRRRGGLTSAGHMMGVESAYVE